MTSSSVFRSGYPISACEGQAKRGVEVKLHVGGGQVDRG